MKIAAIKAELPSRIVDNDELVEIIRKNSEDIYEGNINIAVKHIKRLLEYSGSNRRHWLAPGETPLQLIEKAFNNALTESGWQKEDIDLIIYVGIGRAVIEPGNSYVLAQALNIPRAECFDVIDACMSWTRALHLAYQYFKTSTYKKIMIINAEFNVLPDHEGGVGFPQLTIVKKRQELAYKLPAATIGEATTVTLLSNEEAEPYEFHFQSHPHLADLCTIVCGGYELFTVPYQQKRMGKNGLFMFTSYGAELHNEESASYIVNVFKELSVLPEDIEIIFTHASSSTFWGKMGEKIGIANKIYHIFPETGNLVSASIPTAMVKAIQENKLKRGDRVVLWVGSAGMSFAAVTFIY